MVGTRLVDRYKFTPAFAPAVPSSAAPPYVSLRQYNHLTIVINAVNGASGITACAVALVQATDTTGTGSKALGFASVFAQADVATNGDTLAQTAVVSNTFTVTNTASKVSQYIIEVNANDLDVNNGYLAVAVTLANAAAQTVSVEYILSGGRFAGNVANNPSALS